MAENQKSQLTDEEKIERKAKLFRMISRILIGVAVVVIAVFIYFAMGTKENIDTQTEMDTTELRVKIKQIINIQNRYHAEHDEYVRINYLQLAKKIPVFEPNVQGEFKYKFDPETGIATGIEKDIQNDVNGDQDADDGLTLSVTWEGGKTDGSDFFWTDDDKAYFAERAAEQK